MPGLPRHVSPGSETLKNVVEIVAIIGAGIWGVYTFVYQAEIVPNLAPPTLSVTNTLEKAGTKGNTIAIHSTMTRSNVGQTGVRLLGLTYNVEGIKVRFADTTERPAELAHQIHPSSTVSEARYYQEPQHGEVILRSGVLFKGGTDLPSSTSALNPGEALSRDLVFYADRSRFDLVRVQVRLYYSKESDPAIPLVFEVDDIGQLSAVPAPDCHTKAHRCAGLATTDFASEISLW